MNINTLSTTSLVAAALLANIQLYQCHKRVGALKIAGVHTEFVRPQLEFEETTGFDPLEVDPEWVAKHQPVAGGYLVVYQDGYCSFSPADAFESGYSLVGEYPLPPEVEALSTVDIEAMAGRAYDAYCAAVGSVAFNGDPLPKWKEFRADPAKVKQSDAWVAATQAMFGEFDLSVPTVDPELLKPDTLPTAVIADATRALKGQDSQDSDKVRPGGDAGANGPEARATQAWDSSSPALS